MLIYARIILAIILLASLVQILTGGYLASTGQITAGLFTLVWGGLFLWLSWSNFQEATNCAARYP